MKKWLPLLFIVIFLVILFTYRRFTPQNVDYFLLEPRDFLETLVAAGRVKFSQDIEMAFQIPGVIRSIPVRENQKVQPGDLLVVLDDASERNQVELARADLALAEINLRKLTEHERQLAHEEYRRAEINRRAAFDRYQQAQMLFGRGSIPEEELKNARLDFETALSLENSARLRLANIEDNGPGFLEAKAQVERSRLQLAQAETNLKKKSLLAPIEGTVVPILKNPGEFVQAGETVMVLGGNPFQVVTSIDEREYKKIQVGMKALVSEQADSQKTIRTASISRIAPVVDPAQGTVEVTLVFDEAVEVKPDAAVNVEIITHEEKGLLLAPKRYLVMRNDQPAVWIEEKGKSQIIPLSQVEYLGEWVKISELAPGTVLLDPRGLREGRRIILKERRSN